MIISILCGTKSPTNSSPGNSIPSSLSTGDTAGASFEWNFMLSIVGGVTICMFSDALRRIYFQNVVERKKHVKKVIEPAK